MHIWDGVVEVFSPLCPPRGSSIAKRAEVMQSQDKTRHQLQSTNNALNKSPRRGCNSLALSSKLK